MLLEAIVILCYWKLLLVLFKSTNNCNYAKEAVNILFQYNYTFSDQQKAQLLWSRCVNTRGIVGVNIPCDLFMEHLNRRLKNAVTPWNPMQGNCKRRERNWTSTSCVLNLWRTNRKFTFRPSFSTSTRKRPRNCT